MLIDPTAYAVCTGGINQLMLPPNLLIYATVNVSYESLFLMDGAFKRRWDWQYVPVDYEDAKLLVIELDNNEYYSWSEFIRSVNQHIATIIKAENKQLGNRFVSPIDGWVITKEMFINKVLFYLWSEVYQNEPEERNIFRFWTSEVGQTDLIPFRFLEIFEGKESESQVLTTFMHSLNQYELTEA